ncbi:hypothetical protein FOA52_002897 [Chlamydomonas sp. UWO 241]|nr:hypothetical protein FOA52_002897 [Chlamydomonas sp. UWO 241]
MGVVHGQRHGQYEATVAARGTGRNAQVCVTKTRTAFDHRCAQFNVKARTAEAAAAVAARVPPGLRAGQGARQRRQRWRQQRRRR